MKKRFLHTCINPLCEKEFAIIRSVFLDKSGKFGSLRVRCPHCKKLQKIVGKFKSKEHTNL